jgi:hypothetical protein
MEEDRNAKLKQGSKSKTSEESVSLDEEYEESLDFEVEVPDKNPVSEAIYQKYHQHKQPIDSVIKEVDEDD